MITKMSKQQEPYPAGGYVLMTAAYNEEANIERTIQSVLGQTQLPQKWVIVSDGSIDGTDAIVQRYAAEHEFIHFERFERSPGRSFRSKVIALRRASQVLQGHAFDFIGNLDADISLGRSYFEDLTECFASNPRLGLAGGFVYEKRGEAYEALRHNRVYSVPHGAQLVRRECYEAIGGYAVLEYGGEDWHAETCARMNGWTAEAFAHLPIFHHRSTGEADNLLRYKFRAGRMDYSFGSDTLFESFKCLDRIIEKPLLLGGMARLAGFAWSWVRRDCRPVSDEFVAFVRRGQRERLKLLLPWYRDRNRYARASSTRVSPSRRALEQSGTPITSALPEAKDF